MYKYMFFLSDFFSFTKKIINYFRVVFTDGNKQYFVERITYSSRLVKYIKIAYMHKIHLKVYTRPVFDMFCNIVFKIYDVKKSFWCQNVSFRLKFLPALKTGPVFFVPLKRIFFSKFHINQWENIVVLKVKADYEFGACCSNNCQTPP